jgi:hypothetical protein
MQACTTPTTRCVAPESRTMPAHYMRPLSLPNGLNYILPEDA